MAAAEGSLAKTKSLYSVHPAVAMVQRGLASVPEKTGRSVEQWRALAEKAGIADPKAVREWLRKEHGLGLNTAGWIADSADEGDMGSPEAYLKAAEHYVKKMFEGKKAGLLPIHEALLQLCVSLGSDVKVCPCRTMVPFYRAHVFAQVKPSTATRIDFGLALGARKGSGRLIETGGYAKKDRITHRIAISALSEIDSDVKRWARTAYDEDSK